MMISLNHTQAQLLQPPFTTYEYIKIPNPPGGSINSTYGIGAYPTVIIIRPDRSIAEQDIWPIDNSILRAKVLQHGGIPQDCNAVYALSLLANPPQGGEVIGEGEYHPGDEVEVNAMPNEGWEFINWTNQLGLVVSTEPLYNFIMPESNLTLIANFESHVGTDDLSMVDPGFILFPNPASSQINLHINRKLTDAIFIISDQVGRTVLTGKILSEKTVLDLSDLSKGIYMFSIADHMNKSVKIIRK